MSDTGTDAATETPALPGDGLRESVVEQLRAEIGDRLLDTHLVPQRDLWIRVAADAWLASGRALKAHGFDYFCFLSGIDWLPSPFGKGEDDPSAPPSEPSSGTGVMRQGVTGGDTRFQVFARLTDTRRHVGVTLKVDVPESMAIDSWMSVFAGANWHERETHEMFGIGFDGHTDLRNLYLPSAFEGYPLRKDFPLLSRMVKPWPGIVDVEPMPGQPDEASVGESGAAGDTAAPGEGGDTA